MPPDEAQRPASVAVLATSLPAQPRNPRQIFVAYSYRLYNRADYTKVYRELEKPFNVKFIFADEKITTLHILEKIAGYIKTSAFGIYDISGWNPNVTLELGLAYGLGERAFIAFDPSKTATDEAPADLRGIDRLQYSSYTELGAKLETLLAQELPLPRKHEAVDQLEQLREQAVRIVTEAPGQSILQIADTLGIPKDLAQVVVRPLVGDRLEMRGATRGARYFPPTT